ncbi:MAG TPA: hypothetical protein VK900_21480 [Anaerolineales bacterium]|nr:hypothetical protein [Anaerolineales bacterium]
MPVKNKDQYPEGEQNPSPGENIPEPQQDERPIPVETHYQIFKSIETSIKEHLGSLDHNYFLVGLRVAYDRYQSASEPGVLPFSVEFGYLAPADAIAKCPMEEPGENGEAMEEALRQRSQRAAIPFDRLKEFYEMTKEELQGATSEEIRVGIYIVVTGSPVQSYVYACDCPSRVHRACCWNPTTMASECVGCSGIC